LAAFCTEKFVQLPIWTNNRFGLHFWHFFSQTHLVSLDSANPTNSLARFENIKKHFFFEKHWRCTQL
jgi:hypothetical protein